MRYRGRRYGAGVCLAFVFAAGCMTRPVAPSTPTTKAVVTGSLSDAMITKVDLLFAIDNSASMADKQALLKDAVPDLIRRLLVPNCVDPAATERVLGTSENGKCATGELEFQPITDLHVGVVSSSIGGVGSSACARGTARHDDDRGQLITRGVGDDTGARPDAPSGYLAWFPGSEDQPPPPTAITQLDKLVGNFEDMVAGVQDNGCGYEAQQESWYRFLVQPDPWNEVRIENELAVFDGVNEVILKQRHDFLRPDSLVAIIEITDENESTVDPRSIRGRGFNLLEKRIRLGSSACATDPNSAACVSCSVPGAVGCDGSVDEAVNVRFLHPKQRFGVDPLYPLERYVNGLGIDPKTGTEQKVLRVPNRDGEHPNPNSAYAFDNNCTNPLFAKNLPTKATDELCKLERGPRTPRTVFFAAITGVPSDLLHFDPTSADKSRLVDADWKKILGNDPLRYDFGGADTRMLESIAVRPDVSTDRDTSGSDLQYACTFPLPTPKHCAANDSDCECQGKPGPLCDPADSHTQIAAKAYPGVRHLALAKALGSQGIVSSICPSDTRDASPTNPFYGYRPAMKSISDRLSAALAAQCLPRPLARDDSGHAPCLVFEALGDEAKNAKTEADDSVCDHKGAGLSRPDADVARAFRAQRLAEGTDLSNVPICVLTQLVPPGGASCTKDDGAGWCYAESAAAAASTKGQCAQAILFSRKGRPESGRTVYLTCIEAEDGVTK